MKKRIVVIILIVLSIILVVLGLLLSKENKTLENNKIKIMDATVVCKEVAEVFYEDENYIYSFPCMKSNSIYVKLSDNNKMLVVDALDEKKVTIEELIKAGLEVQKSKK